MSEEIDKVGGVIDLIMQGYTLRKIFRDSSLSMGKFYEILNSNPELMQRYEQAQQIRAEVFADEIIEIADDTTNDAAHNKNRMAARTWYASKLKPKTYGDKTTLEINQTIDIRGALTDARSRVSIQAEYSHVDNSRIEDKAKK